VRLTVRTLKAPLTGGAPHEGAKRPSPTSEAQPSESYERAKRASPSVPEVAQPGEYHGQAVFISRGNHFGVTH
jgi:hypothetical protein